MEVLKITSNFQHTHNKTFGNEACAYIVSVCGNVLPNNRKDFITARSFVTSFVWRTGRVCGALMLIEATGFATDQGYLIVSFC